MLGACRAGHRHRNGYRVTIVRRVFDPHRVSAAVHTLGRFRVSLQRKGATSIHLGGEDYKRVCLCLSDAHVCGLITGFQWQN